MPADEEEAARFARDFAQFLKWVQRGETRRRRPNEVVRLIREQLGASGREQSVVTRGFPAFEQVNLQVAVDAWSVAPGRTVDLHGLTVAAGYGPVRMRQLVRGRGLRHVQLSPPDFVDLPAGPDRTVACVPRALLLVDDDRGSYVLLVNGPDPQEDQGLTVSVAGLSTSAAQEVLEELAALRAELNVYRGQLIELDAGQGGVGIAFPVLPSTTRDDVVLPEEVLRRAERHTVDIAARRDELLAAGQHLERGVLMYGSPGTGKTHTMRYLVQRLAGSTVLMLSGRSLHLIAMVTRLARELQPSVVVLEDVDLVAEDRGYGSGASPVLFELLEAMDGSAADAACCSCSPPTGPTCWSRLWLPDRDGSTWRSRSGSPTRPRGAGSSTCTAGTCRSTWTRRCSTRWCSGPTASRLRS